LKVSRNHAALSICLTMVAGMTRLSYTFFRAAGTETGARAAGTETRS